MLRNRKASGRAISGCALALATLAHAAGARESGFRVLYAFHGTDGAVPYAGLMADRKGNLYGTTTLGGADDDGVVFRLAPDGTETVLHSFTGGSDGLDPFSGLIADKKGNLYGTTQLGGTCDGTFGCGTVFKIAPDGSETVLYSFTGGSDGANPIDSLIADTEGNLYGTAYAGGSGFGTVFELAPDGAETTLHTFTGTDGANPSAALAADQDGNFYSTTHTDGAGGNGTIFKLAPDGSESVLFSFSDENLSGASPFGGVVMAGKGNLYGTTASGGEQGGCGGYGCGVVFKLSAKAHYTVLHTFTGGNDGGNPVAGVIADGQGNIYGTTFEGGENGDGVVFKVMPGGHEKVLYAFTGGSDGANPKGALIAGKNGALYGTTTSGGSACGCGVVFEISE
jgi:uncharacterized repeat protein (TIGR03803 family)